MGSVFPVLSNHPSLNGSGQRARQRLRALNFSGVVVWLLSWAVPEKEAGEDEELDQPKLGRISRIKQPFIRVMWPLIHVATHAEISCSRIATAVECGSDERGRIESGWRCHGITMIG
jgi:hypothetical protein